jgi:hypothetical protein
LFVTKLNTLRIAGKVPDVFTQVFVIEKDSKRFPDGGGWGYALLNDEAGSDTFTADPSPSDSGHACHVAVKANTTSSTRTRSVEPRVPPTWSTGLYRAAILIFDGGLVHPTAHQLQSDPAARPDQSQVRCNSSKLLGR